MNTGADSPILVTGARGFMGRALTRELTRRGIAFVGVDREEGDICSMDWSGITPGYVIHLAARAFVPESWEQPEAFYRVNALGTLHVLEACRRWRAPLLLMSTYAYGTPQSLPIDEDHPVAANNPYALSKLAAEQAAQFYQRAHGLPLTILRPFNPYGPGQPAHFLTAHILRQLTDPACPEVRVLDARPRRDYVFLQDLVDAVLLLVTGGVQGVFNLGSGRSVSVAELATCAMQALDIHKPLVSEGKERPGEIPDVVADCTRLRQATGWTPKISLETGLRLTCYPQESPP